MVDIPDKSLPSKTFSTSNMTGHYNVQQTKKESRPKSFRYHIKWYTLNLGLMISSFSMIWATLAIVISLIEKRYSLSSLQSGFIFGAAEVGRLSMLFVISHFGNKFSIPRVVAIFGIGISIGQLMIALPHFLFTPDAVKIVSSEQFCMANITFTTTASPTIEGGASGNTNAYAMMIAGMVLMGMSLSPISNIALSYIDNNAEEGTAPMYLGLIQAAFGVGAVIAPFMAVKIVTLYVDLTPTDLTPNDPAFVGAWWLIILIISGCVFITAPFVAIYPKNMKTKGEITVSDMKRLTDLPTLNDRGDGQDILEVEGKYTIGSLFTTLWRLVKNPVFMTLCIYMIFRDLADFGYKIYTAKYMGIQYGMGQQEIVIHVGSMSIVSVGAYAVGGWIVKKLKLTYQGTIKLVFAIGILHIAIHLALMNVGCDSLQIAGKQQNNAEVLPTQECNNQCDCNTAFYSPFCDEKHKLTYFSPCYAGCPATTNFTQTKTECTCAPDVKLKKGSCFECSRMYKVIFLILSYTEFFPYAFPFAPVTALLLRCVRKEDKSLALGFSVVLVSSLGWMTCGAIYGNLIDSACSLWQMLDNHRGACWVYDLKTLRHILYSANVGWYVMSLFMLALTWWFVRRRNVTWTSANEDKFRRDSRMIRKMSQLHENKVFSS